MANPNAPKGFKPIGVLGNTNNMGSLTAYRIQSGYAANIGAGDLVSLAATGYVTTGTASGRTLGVSAGVSDVDFAGVPQVKPNWVSGTVTFAAQDATILVYDDPALVVEGRFSAALLVTNASVGNTFPMLVGAPDIMGNSTQAADTTSVTLTTIQPLRFIGFAPRPDNDPAAVQAVGRFILMNHEYKAITGV